MNRKYHKLMKLGALVIGLGLLTSNVYAIDFSQDEAKYQKLCQKRSSYRANKSTCSAFENYLKERKAASAKAAGDIKGQIDTTKSDISKLTTAIKKNAELIDGKKKEVTKIQDKIKVAEDEIKDLEAEMLKRLAMMQEVTTENFVVDFLMSASSLDDLLTKVDGINAINDSNNDIVLDLVSVKKELDSKKKELNDEKVKLDKAQKEQNQMLKDYQAKEAELFVKLEAEQKKRAVYNSSLNNINLDGVAASKGFIKPVKHATPTALAWYYPADFGGGWHPGIDLANSTGTPVVAPANGVVLLTSSGGGGYGNFMVTAHQMGNDTYTFLYGHLNSFGKTSGSIKQGQTIGYMGSTGNSTGPHTHFEVYKHKNRKLKSVVNQYKNSGDFYFGLGYSSIGSCSNVCRIQPQKFLGVKYMQAY
ncbi:MAG: peptidoglycan DD-metalloendopeptidase family protein [Erysipelotrichales bacterium]